MKTIGLVGGVGPESTIDYYRAMIAAHREQQPDGSYPSIVINSIDLNRLIGSIGNGELAAAADYLVDAVEALARAGAAFGLIGANAPHIVFDEVQRRSPIPLVSIVQATCDAAKARGFTRLGLFGARFTMQGRFYPDVFSKAGMTLATPHPDEQIYIHDKYMTELVKGVLLDDTRNELVRIAARLKERASIEALILGGTELPLILRGDTAAGLPLLDTTRIHAHSAVVQSFA
jgi:aspartate racemase